MGGESEGMTSPAEVVRGLRALVAPPISGGNIIDWTQMVDYGHGFPDDYRVYMEVYGEGIEVYIPSSPVREETDNARYTAEMGDFDEPDMLIARGDGEKQQTLFAVDFKDYRWSNHLVSKLRADGGDKGKAGWILVPDHRESQIRQLTEGCRRHGMKAATATDFLELVVETVKRVLPGERRTDSRAGRAAGRPGLGGALLSAH
ncbi:restriction endonuclease-related protein [Streptomyces sp. RPT161]|uniref:restriction endonuclease-related protein n=1 Tax=Streptomyces sp. RPT161 TaxID=3015993 RepID=UPI0022B8BF65|nr:hypothetical protein [Streptomyces sp. RPT161]